MSQAIGAVLAYAVGVGISPIPIIAVVLMLLSQRASSNGPAFLAGWLVGLAGLFTAVVALAGALDVGTSDTADDGVKWLRLALGVLLLVAAGRKWTKRTREGDEPTMPPWMARLDVIAPGRAGGLGVLLSLNPKNLLLAIGAGTSVAQLDASTSHAVAAGAVFVLVGSAIAIAAVVYQAVGGARAQSGLEDLKAWMTAHNSAIMMVLFAVFGALLIAQGLGVRG